MASRMENPARAARGVPVTVQATSTNTPESKSSLRELQACHLTRRCAISFAMAAIVAPLLHGEAR
jgi:hypothetical protein